MHVAVTVRSGMSATSQIDDCREHRIVAQIVRLLEEDYYISTTRDYTFFFKYSESHYANSDIDEDRGSKYLHIRFLIVWTYPAF